MDCNNGNAPIDGETNQVFTAMANGSYAVIITDSNCQDPQTSTCYDVNTLGLSDINVPFVVKFYPNPVKEELNISLNQSFENANLQIYSISGQLIEEFNANNKLHLNVDMSRYSSGTYILKVYADGKIKSDLIIKQ